MELQKWPILELLLGDMAARADAVKAKVSNGAV
jgi:hypothetical protein